MQGLSVPEAADLVWEVLRGYQIKSGRRPATVLFQEMDKVGREGGDSSGERASRVSVVRPLRRWY